MGLTYDKRRSTWNARITISGKRLYLGSFKTEREALEAYLRVKIFSEMAKHFMLQDYKVPFAEDDKQVKWFGSFKPSMLKKLISMIDKLYSALLR